MIKWLKYSSETGEDVEYCCNIMKLVYGNLVHWDAAEKCWCIETKRIATHHNPNTGKNYTKIEKDKLDMIPINYCPFCGKNVYKDELRYDTWITHD